MGRRGKKYLLDEEGRKKFLHYYGIHCHKRNCFVPISKALDNKFTAKQLSNHWANYLNPKLCKEPLTQKEKAYIIKKIENYKLGTTKKISWKLLIEDLKNESGKLHSHNKVKNFYSAWLRSPKNGERRNEEESLKGTELNRTESEYLCKMVETTQFTAQHTMNKPFIMEPDPYFDYDIRQKGQIAFNPF